MYGDSVRKQLCSCTATTTSKSEGQRRLARAGFTQSALMRSICRWEESRRVNRERTRVAWAGTESQRPSGGAGRQRQEAQRLTEQILAYIKESGNRREPRHALGESHVRSAKARQIVASLRKSCTIGKPLIHLNHVARPGFCGPQHRLGVSTYRIALFAISCAISP